MNAMKLTSRGAPAHKAPMLTRLQGFAGTIRMLVAVPFVAVLPGCITVNAPDKPIVIELNINIKQEVLYKIQQDVEDTIQENSSIF
jgi:hypothetical protein